MKSNDAYESALYSNANRPFEMNGKSETGVFCADDAAGGYAAKSGLTT